MHPPSSRGAQGDRGQRAEGRGAGFPRQAAEDVESHLALGAMARAEAAGIGGKPLTVKGLACVPLRGKEGGWGETTTFGKIYHTGWLSRGETGTYPFGGKLFAWTATLQERTRQAPRSSSTPVMNKIPRKGEPSSRETGGVQTTCCRWPAVGCDWFCVGDASDCRTKLPRNFHFWTPEPLDGQRGFQLSCPPHSSEW